jgi:dipeptidyl aminopeptidase/acylaminoacyl peptidase
MTQFTTRDLLKLELIRDLQVRPDGREVAYETKIIDEAADAYRSSITVVPVAGGDPVELVRATAQNTMPRWSPDGTQLAFLSDRGGGPPALHVIARGGGEARLVKRFDQGIVSIAWAPDGKSLLATRTVDHEEPPDGDRQAARWVDRPRRAHRQRYKSDGSGFLLHGTTRLVSIRLADGEVTELTGEADEIGSACYSPDGTQIAFAMNRNGARDSHRTDIWMMRADGSDRRRLTSDLPSAASPAWSPDGKWIACVGDPIEGNSLTTVWLVEVATGTVTNTGRALDITSFPLVRTLPPSWSADSRCVMALCADRGRSVIASVEIATGKHSTIVPEEAQTVTFHQAGDVLAFVRVAADEPGDVHVSIAGAPPRQLTKLNAWWHDRDQVTAERMTFRSPHGDVEGWLLRGPDRQEPRPLVVDVHGGPQSFAEFGLPYHVYWYVLCARGWSVLALDPIGSSGYGREHAMRLRSRWGELDLPQQLAAVEQLQKLGIADHRVAIAGKSYGGFLAALAIGKSKVFRAAIVSAPVANFESHSGTSDSGYYVDPYDLEGELPERRDLARRLSPIQHAHHATTPTLILQGEADARCPIGQSEELFALLMRCTKAPVEMMIYPQGHHDLAEDGRPSHRLDYHQRIVDWLERWIEAPP